jgi:dinuclear metal center YbgI/SA1388 family protein
MDVLETIAPLQLAEPWDNVGLLVGDPQQVITKILLTIDCTHAVVSEAAFLACDLIISYHPPIFTPLKKLTAADVAFQCAQKNISIYCLHTALDAATGGTNDALADLFALQNVRPLREATNMGRIGMVTKCSASDLIVQIKQALQLEHLLFAGDMQKSVEYVAVCAGAGGEFLRDAIEQKACLFVTGELRHHQALQAKGHGLAVVCTLHSQSERLVLPRLQEKLQLLHLPILISQHDRDPYLIA